jgi:hypothetical protein
MSVLVTGSFIFSAIADAVVEQGYDRSRLKINKLRTQDGAEIVYDDKIALRVFCLVPGPTNSIPRTIVQIFKGFFDSETLLAVANRLNNIFKKENFDIQVM